MNASNELNFLFEIDLISLLGILFLKHTRKKYFYRVIEIYSKNDNFIGSNSRKYHWKPLRIPARLLKDPLKC